jgi:hypothetical protein
VKTPAEPVLIGRDAGPFGRTFRLVSGALLVVSAITDAGSAAELAGIVGFVLLLAVFYTGLHRLLGIRALAGLDPFVATVLVLGTLPLWRLSVFPEPLHAAVGLYIGASLLVTAAIGYGGCEVLAVPTVIFRRRQVVYCPFNIVDAAERPLRRSPDLLGRGAAIAALVLAGYFLVVSPVVGQFAPADPVPPRWALLLLAPAAVLAWRAWSARDSTAWAPALGAAALVALALVHAGFLHQDIVFASAVLAGLIIAGVRLVIAHRRRRDEVPE